MNLESVSQFEDLFDYLRDTLGWPLPEDASLSSLTYRFTPGELGLKSDVVGPEVEILQLRPMTANQPWGIFLLNLPHRDLPETIVKSVLGKLTVKKRAAANDPMRPAFSKSDLLFITARSGEGERNFAFAHFKDEGNDRAPRMNVIGWERDDTSLRRELTETTLESRLSWPDTTSDSEVWRALWRGAFTERPRQSVRTSQELARVLAGYARRLRDRALLLLGAQTERGSLVKLYKAFKDALIHDLTPAAFADTYAQTITYGLLSSAMSRASGTVTQEQFKLSVMTTSPFLRSLLESFIEAGGQRPGGDGALVDFDELEISEIVEFINGVDMKPVVADFAHVDPGRDPVVYLYELFLQEYDPTQRFRRGVFYTPRQVVRFIVGSVHESFRTEFELEDGLASTVTWGELIAMKPGISLPEGVDAGDPFVRILDPATGTGTFLVETIDLIARTMKSKWATAGRTEGEISRLWNDYVPEHLLPRIYGFELMAAPFAIAHMKLGLKLYETGYRFEGDVPLRVHLTNALEPAKDHAAQLPFMKSAMAREALEANEAKRLSFTAIIGNPPYSQYSANLQAFAKAHIDRFRHANGARIQARNALQLERNLNDDYVKFLGLSFSLLPAGVIGMITNRYFLESESLVGLREAMATGFGTSRIVDLMGSAEEAQRVERLQGDENVFEIKQGVAISLFVRGAGSGPRSASIPLIGSRSSKTDWLEDHVATPPAWDFQVPAGPDWLLGSAAAERSPDFALNEIFPHYSTLVASNRDPIVVGFDRDEVIERVGVVAANRESDEAWSKRFRITLKTNWNVRAARAQLRAIKDFGAFVRPIQYRPFDERCIFYHKALVWQMAPVPSENVLQVPGNRVLISMGKSRDERVDGFWIAQTLADKSVVSTRDNASGFPLWLRPEGIETRTRPNIAPAFADQVAAATGLRYDDTFDEAPRRSGQDDGSPASFGPSDLLHWVYALLHSPGYRQAYANELKTGFPRIPLPASRALFQDLIPFGAKLSALHRLDVDHLPELDDPRTVRLAAAGEPRITMPAARFDDEAWDNGRMYISAARDSWFEAVPERVADYHVGGYRPARKWLKDRAGSGGTRPTHGRLLTDEDQLRYRRMVLALDRTVDLTAEIDRAVEVHGGWPGAFNRD